MSAHVSLRWARIAVVVAVVLLVLKAVAAWLTGSRAVFSDAAESVVNVVASSIMLLAVRAATKPADTEHPFGHGKAELLAAASEGALLVAAAVTIAWDALPALFAPQPTEHPGLGGLLVGVTAVANAGFGVLLIRNGRRNGSPALVADGKHLLTDAVSTVVVLASMALVALTGLRWIDPLAAAVLAVWIAYTGVSVVLGAARGLLDTRTPAYAQRIAETLRTAPVDGLLDPHDLRVVDSTRNVVVLLHARTPWMWTVERAQQVSDTMAQQVRTLFDVPAELHLQLEPCTPRCCARCSVEVCSRRVQPHDDTAPVDASRLEAPHPHSG